METSIVVPKKLKIELPCDPTIHYLVKYSKEIVITLKGYLHAHFATALMASIWKQPKRGSADE